MWDIWCVSAEKGGGSMPGARHIDFKDLFKPDDGTIKEDKDLKDCKQIYRKSPKYWDR